MLEGVIILYTTWLCSYIQSSFPIPALLSTSNVCLLSSAHIHPPNIPSSRTHTAYLLCFKIVLPSDIEPSFPTFKHNLPSSLPPTQRHPLSHTLPAFVTCFSLPSPFPFLQQEEEDPRNSKLSRSFTWWASVNNLSVLCLHVVSCFLQDVNICWFLRINLIRGTIPFINIYQLVKMSHSLPVFMNASARGKFSKIFVSLVTAYLIFLQCHACYLYAYYI